jgi:hypothetical protein
MVLSTMVLCTAAGRTDRCAACLRRLVQAGLSHVPSPVDVALPSSSTSTSELPVASLMMYAMSCISTMKLLLLVSMLSDVPICTAQPGRLAGGWPGDGW